jgi:hypothetical protein
MKIQDNSIKLYLIEADNFCLEDLSVLYEIDTPFIKDDLYNRPKDVEHFKNTIIEIYTKFTTYKLRAQYSSEKEVKDLTL